MCGIVGAIGERDAVPLLLEGLRRLEYRGYDSSGIAVINSEKCIDRERMLGKVQVLADTLKTNPINGHLGIAHTRWATHGQPSQQNAHPHICRKGVAVVHNGIIENHQALRAMQLEQGYEFTSETDTEVVVHQIYNHQAEGKDLLLATRDALVDLEGAYALGVISNHEPNRLVAARRGSPLVIGLGIGENFIASDVAALLPVTRRFIFLEEGDVADIRRDSVEIYDESGERVERPEIESSLTADSADKGSYRHYMLKEIYEQPQAVTETMEGRITNGKILDESFGPEAAAIFDKIMSVQIIACGTSYHAGMVARNWFEGVAGVPCHVEVASEFRYRHPVADPDALVVVISQSGETADTLAALRATKKWGFGPSLAICNVPESSLSREADLSMLTRAGPEIGVASTKAFTTQLVALLMLVVAIGRRYRIDAEREAVIVKQLQALPRHIEDVLKLDDEIKQISERFADKHNALFLGRGVQYPIAMEGALKLKEISYIHAEAYPAGELKHGPLALVDEMMPIIAVAPNDELLEKLKSNLEEVRARGGELYLFADHDTGMESGERIHVMTIPPGGGHVSPIIFTIPLQLLSYHVAVLKGTDVDQPRNLAKSVTVE
ncbi:MAG: glutamine--fructose-6-phosphate transaminase (isomerizing) [Gammaproteobacteria bacterium]|nr:glutamine--fructose-6-phosphate transaminase (isomerizing) [Gammaproteobacteria bacterium]